MTEEIDFNSNVRFDENIQVKLEIFRIRKTNVLFELDTILKYVRCFTVFRKLHYT